MAFSVKFWGVRGSIACSGPRTARYGGNTSSIEVRCGERVLLFDAGTGFRYLGHALASSGPLDADLFLTHTHFDHVAGLPFFKPFFQPENRFRLWAGHLGERMTLRRVLGEFMMSPLSRWCRRVFRARMEYREFRAGETLKPAPDVAVRTTALNHPDGAPAIASITPAARCATPHRACSRAPDRNILELIAGADLVIYDSMYTDAEYETYTGWGHSTWQEGVRLCREAGAKRLCVFHHDPEHDDDMLDGIALEVERQMPGSVVAKDGLVLNLD